MDKTKKIFWIALYFFVCCVFLGFVIFSTFGIVMLAFRGNSTLENENETNLYKYTQLDPSTNETSSGFVTIFEDLKDNGYVYYRDASRNHVLISDFGSEEYKCTGRCICKGDQYERRYSSVVFTRSIMYLVAAVTSFVAYEKSIGHFERECRKELSDSCSVDSSIKSEVDSCEPISSKTSESDTVDSEENVRGRFREFFCRGHCLTKKFKRGKARAVAQVVNCERHSTEGYVKIDVTRWGFPSNDWTDRARLKFQNEFIIPFCGMVDRATSTDWKTSRLKNFKKLNQVCSGESRGRRINPSIRCTMVK